MAPSPKRAETMIPRYVRDLQRSAQDPHFRLLAFAHNPACGLPLPPEARRPGYLLRLRLAAQERGCTLKEARAFARRVARGMAHEQ